MSASSKIHAVYVIVDDGRCAYSKAYSEIAPSPHLVSAMLTAMQVFINEVLGTFFSEVTAGPFSFISEQAGPFSVVIVGKKSEGNVEKAKYLVLRFIKRYKSHIEQWNGEMMDFNEFDEDVHDIFGNIEDIRIDPKIPLDAIALIQLDEDLQSTAKLILTKGEVMIHDVMEHLDLPEFIVKLRLQKLFDMGYTGRFTSGGKFYYFI